MEKVKLNILNYLEDKSFNANHIHLSIKGNKVNYQNINLIRKIISEDIPTKAFDINNINIYKNTSVYNNDYLRNRFENIPIINIPYKLNLNLYDKALENVININKFNNLDYDDSEIIDIDEVEMENKNVIENKQDVLEIFCDYTNNDTSNIYITSDDCKYYYNNNEIKSIYHNKILFLILKPNESVKFSIKSNINIGMYHISYSPVSICCYDIIEDSNEIILKYESKDNISIKNILIYAIEIIKHKLKKLLNKIDNFNIENKLNGNIILNIEDNKLIDIIILHLQEDDNIKFAGFSKNLLTNIITIEYILFDNKITIKLILNKIINNIISFYDNLLNEFNNLKMLK